MCRFCLILFIWCLLFSFSSFAGDDPTIVYGSAATPDGKQKVFVVEQPKDAPNPLGNPIVGPDKPVEVFGNLDGLRDNQNQLNSHISEESENQNNLGSDFENTLLEANDRVYDVQSYPEADFKAMSNPSNPQTIYSPNVND